MISRNPRYNAGRSSYTASTLTVYAKPSYACMTRDTAPGDVSINEADLGVNLILVKISLLAIFGEVSRISTRARMKLLQFSINYEITLIA